VGFDGPILYTKKARYAEERTPIPRIDAFMAAAKILDGVE
jgi:hypothetical protein